MKGSYLTHRSCLRRHVFSLEGEKDFEKRGRVWLGLALEGSEVVLVHEAKIIERTIIIKVQACLLKHLSLTIGGFCESSDEWQIDSLMELD